MSPRDNIPPYEIMRRRAGEDAPAPVRAPVPGSGAAGGLWQRLRDWWPAADEPLNLRIPRGVAVAVLIGGLGLLILAYWVGHSRGTAKARAAHEQRVEDHRGIYGSRPAPSLPYDPDSSKNAGQTGASAVDNGGISSAAPPRIGGDPRKPGDNYVVLLTTTPDEADRLIRFLKPYGVEAIAVSSNNKRFDSVVALRGFPGSEKGSDAWNEYLETLKRIGREWKRFNGNKGSDLSDMYFSLYRGE